MDDGSESMGWDGIRAAAAMIPLQPPAASSIAGEVDQLYYLLTGIITERLLYQIPRVR